MPRTLIAALVASALHFIPIAGAQEIAPPPPAPAGAAPETLLDPLIQHSRRTARIVDGRLSGPGSDLLRDFGRNSHFIVIGEQHGNAGIAQFATAYWRDLSDDGYAYAVTESDPWVTRALERELRAGGPEAWRQFVIRTGAGAAAAPFYTWRGEVEWVDAVVSQSSVRRALWGVDQVFIGAAPHLMRDIAQNARSAQARALAARLAEGSEGDLNWFARIDPASMQQLRAHLSGRRDGDYAALVDAMIVSQRIYRPFTGGGGEAYLANEEREHLMRRLFTEEYARAEAADRRPPRVMMKLGASHAYRGASATQVQGFGGFVSEFAAARGQRATTILALCGPNSQASRLIGPSAPCMDDNYTRAWRFLEPHLDPDAITVFDLRIWRLRPRRWATLPIEVQQQILSFDVLVFVPTSPGAQLLEGLDPIQPPTN